MVHDTSLFIQTFSSIIHARPTSHRRTVTVNTLLSRGLLEWYLSSARVTVHLCYSEPRIDALFGSIRVRAVGHVVPARRSSIVLHTSSYIVSSFSASSYWYNFSSASLRSAAAASLGAAAPHHPVSHSWLKFSAPFYSKIYARPWHCLILFYLGVFVYWTMLFFHSLCFLPWKHRTLTTLYSNNVINTARKLYSQCLLAFARRCISKVVLDLPTVNGERR